MPQFRVESGLRLKIVVTKTAILPADIAALGFAAALQRSGLFGWAQGMSGDQRWDHEAPPVMGQLQPYDVAPTGWSGTATLRKLVVEDEKLVENFGVPPEPTDDLEAYLMGILARELIVISLVDKVMNTVQRRCKGQITAESFQVDARTLATGTAQVILATPF